jgi:hypothetical protein
MLVSHAFGIDLVENETQFSQLISAHIYLVVNLATLAGVFSFSLVSQLRSCL